MSVLTDRVAIVTGASSGIGRATALLLAREGANAGSTGEVAQSVLYLASEASSFVTGTALRVDGGLSITRT